MTHYFAAALGYGRRYTTSAKTGYGTHDATEIRYFKPNCYRKDMSDDNIVVWSADTALKWDDFAAEPHPGTYQDAIATIRYNCTWSIESHDADGILSFSISKIRLSTIFVKNLSWARIGMVNERLRVHMQGCFDLAEYIRPDMENALVQRFKGKLYPARGATPDEQQQNSVQDSRVVLGALQDIHKELDAKIAEYQDQTKHGEDESSQTRYSQRFTKMKNAKSA